MFSQVVVYNFEQAAGVVMAWLTGFSGFLALCSIIYGFFSFYVSSGDYSKKQSAYKSINIGIVLFLASIVFCYISYVILKSS